MNEHKYQPGLDPTTEICDRMWWGARPLSSRREGGLSVIGRAIHTHVLYLYRYLSTIIFLSPVKVGLTIRVYVI